MQGIYLIRNLKNGKGYVGQSIDIHTRWAAHKKNCHNEHLKRAFSYYGEENFDFSILEELPNESADYITEREQYWIDLLNSMNPKFGYNRRGAGSKGKHMEETIEKIKKSHASDEAKLLYSSGAKKMWEDPIIRDKIITNLKACWTPEMREKASKKTKERMADPEVRRVLSEKYKGVPRSEDVCKRISDGAKGKTRSHENIERMQKLQSTPEYKKRLSDSVKKVWENPEHRARVVAGNTGKKRTEEQKKRTSEQLKALWKDPVYRECMMEKQRKKKGVLVDNEDTLNEPT